MGAYQEYIGPIGDSMTDLTYDEALNERLARFNQGLLGVAEAMESLSRWAEEVRPQLEVVAETIMAACRAAYRDAGEPCGPARDYDNVIAWLGAVQNRDNAKYGVYRELMYAWAKESTRAQIAGEPIPPPPREPA